MENKTKKMTGLAILTAVIVVLTIVCTFVRFGPFSITLALAPIIIGGALYGRRAGAFLGTVFGAVVLITGFLGWDGGTVLFLMSKNKLAVAETILICLVKGAAAGYVSAVVYKLIAPQNSLAAVILASVLCPVVNTGLFIAGMLLFFKDVLLGWASGASLIYYVIFGLTGINFVVELLSNLILSSAVTRIIGISKKII